MKSITEKEYRNFANLRNELNELILEKVTQMALIQYNRLPEGVCYEHYFDEEDGKIMIQFESWHCGESDYDTYRMPLEFLFDETYAEKYKLIWQEEVRRKKEERELRKKQMEEEKKRIIENHEYNEYKRLKAKYDIVGLL